MCSKRKARQFAADRYNARYRAWLRRVWWALPLVALPMVAILVSSGLLFYSQHTGLFWGLGLAAGLAFAAVLAQSVTAAHIDTGSRGPKTNERHHGPCCR